MQTPRIKETPYYVCTKQTNIMWTLRNQMTPYLKKINKQEKMPLIIKDFNKAHFNDHHLKHLT